MNLNNHSSMNMTMNSPVPYNNNEYNMYSNIYTNGVHDILNLRGNANEIICGLWLGDYVSAMDVNFQKKYNISVIINCSKDIPFVDNKEILYKYRIPVSDNLQQVEIYNMTGYIKEIIPIIHEHLSKGHNILVHCMAGMQRSAIVVLAYLYAYYFNNIPCQDNTCTPVFRINHCIKYLKSKRSVVFFPKMNFKWSICKVFNINF